MFHRILKVQQQHFNIFDSLFLIYITTKIFTLLKGCLFSDILTSKCRYELAYDPNTKTYRGTVKVKATRDFIDDKNRHHELVFKPIFSIEHEMWRNYKISPVQVNHYGKMIIFLHNNSFINLTNSILCICTHTLGVDLPNCVTLIQT